MKIFKLSKYFYFIIFILICSCGPIKKIQVTPVDYETETFIRAEHEYEIGAYSDALRLYLKYLSHSPDGAMKERTLMRLGSIYALNMRCKDSRDMYNRLLDEHPDTIFALDARKSILVSYYKEKNYEKVIIKGNELLEMGTQADQGQIFRIIASAQLALEKPVDAIKFLSKSYELSTGTDKEKVLPLVQNAVEKLNKDQILLLLDEFKNKFPTGYLMFRLSEYHIKEEAFKDAVKMLSKLIEVFPYHKRYHEAEKLITDIKDGLLSDRYTIGCILPLSGNYAKFGNRALTGMELALYNFNSRKGGYQVRLKVEDTESNPEKAAKAVEKLAGENVMAIVGPITTAEAEPAALKAQAKKVPIITLTSKNTAELGDYVFRNFLTSDMQVRAICSYAVKKLKLKKFAIIYPDEPYGKSYLNKFWSTLIEYGGSVTAVESYSKKQADFAELIKKLTGLYHYNPLKSKVKYRNKKSVIDFEGIFIPDSPAKIALIAPQLAFHDITKVKLLGTNLWHSDILIKTSRAYVQEAIIPDGFFAESSSQNVKNFVKSFKNTFESKPGFLEAIAYDTAMMLFELMNNPSIKNRVRLRNAIQNVQYLPGVTGKTSFDTNGDANKQVYLISIEDDKFTELTNK
ncbi:branched-chain amino acid transport system substrate-binding protein [Candidatus Magnetomoraceae bacterium gMMP-1]